MALATLTKGVQAPAYFLGAVAAWLLLSRQWRRLFGPGHLAGAAVGAAFLLAWTIPYALAMGWDETRIVWTGDPAIVLSSRVGGWDGQLFAAHLVRFPLEVAAGTLPWSPMLLCYFWRDFRRRLGAAGPSAGFCAVCVAVALPSCWVPPTGLPRYFAPLLPCVAVLVGVAVQRCAEAEVDSPSWRAWRRYLAAFVVVVVGTGMGLAVVSAFLQRHAVLGSLAEPPLTVAGYLLATLGLAWLLWRARRPGGSARTAVVALAAFMTLTFAGVVHNRHARRSEAPAEAMRRLKEQLPPGQLVSLGRAHPLFAYHYREPLPACEWPRGEPAPRPDAPYFCFLSAGDSRPSLPFAWEEVGTFPVDRNRRPVPEQVMVVGRLRPEGVAGR
jgi:4-amino-4-deoxy-L-arabinose transferase-like glycosyltransferase